MNLEILQLPLLQWNSQQYNLELSKFCCILFSHLIVVHTCQITHRSEYDLSMRKERLYAHWGLPHCTGGLVHFLGSDWLQAQGGYASMHMYWPAHWHIFVCQPTSSQATELVSVVIILSCTLGQWLLHLSSPLPACRPGFMRDASFFEACLVTW